MRHHEITGGGGIYQVQKLLGVYHRIILIQHLEFWTGFHISNGWDKTKNMIINQAKHGVCIPILMTISIFFRDLDDGTFWNTKDMAAAHMPARYLKVSDLRKWSRVTPLKTNECPLKRGHFKRKGSSFSYIPIVQGTCKFSGGVYQLISSVWVNKRISISIVDFGRVHNYVGEVWCDVTWHHTKR